MGLVFYGGRVERRKSGRFNRAGEDKVERWIERKEAQRTPYLGSLPRARGLLRFWQGQSKADGERKIASLKAA